MAPKQPVKAGATPRKKTMATRRGKGRGGGLFGGQNAKEEDSSEDKGREEEEHAEQVVENLRRNEEQVGVHLRSSNAVKQMIGFQPYLCVVKGLQTDSGKVLNGQVAQIMGWHAQSSRAIVRINPGDSKQLWKRLKFANLSRCPADKLKNHCDWARPMLAAWPVMTSGMSSDMIDVGILLDLLKGRVAEGEMHLSGPSAVRDPSEHLKRTAQNFGVFLLHLQRPPSKLSTLLVHSDAVTRALPLCHKISQSMIMDTMDQALEVEQLFVKAITTVEATCEAARVAFVLNEVLPPVPHGRMARDSPTAKTFPSTIQCDIPVIEDVDHGQEDAAIRDNVLLQEKADNGWADAVQEHVHAGPQHNVDAEEHIWIYPFTRTPPEFMQALLSGPDLRPIRLELSANGRDCVLKDSGAKVFVKPEQYATVLQALQSIDFDLRPSHVIIADRFIPELEASIAQIPSRKNVRVKKCDVKELPKAFGYNSVNAPVTIDTNDVVVPSKAHDVHAEHGDTLPNENWNDLYAVDRTFLCTIRCLRNAGSVTQSTTEAHNGVNPRRVIAENC